MSSILTNNGAMVALQTLKSINNDLSKTQNQISTGLEISSAADNASLWAISQVMEADVAGFEAVSSSLSLGESTVAVGRAAAESVNELLVDIKEQIVLAQAPGADTDAIQTEIASLRDQVTSIVGAAQFNGQNLLSNTSTTAGEGTVEVLASLNRDENGAVTTTDINVQKQDLSQTDSAAGATATTDYTVTAAGTPAANGGTGTYTLGFNTGVTEVAAQASFELDLSSFDTTNNTSTATVQYVARDGDTLADVAAALSAAANFQLESEGRAGETVLSASGNVITVTNNDDTAVTGALAAGDFTLTDDGTIGGGLEILGDIDVSTTNGADAASAAIDYLIETAVGAAADLGTSQSRMQIQNDFISSLSDSLKSGIGALVDANMEEASARLQALQVQQQLAIQSLSIANQAPQNILSLFR